MAAGLAAAVHRAGRARRNGLPILAESILRLVSSLAEDRQCADRGRPPAGFDRPAAIIAGVPDALGRPTRAGRRRRRFLRGTACNSAAGTLS